MGIEINRAEKASDIFKEGQNCAQSVILAFADVLDLDYDLLKRMAAAFGGGFAKTRNICGAVSAIGMIVGLIDESDGDKASVYKQTRILTDEFEKLNGTLLCGELLKNMPNITKDYKPSERTAEYYAVRPCVKLVMDAVEIIQNSDIYRQYLERTSIQ